MESMYVSTHNCIDLVRLKKNRRKRNFSWCYHVPSFSIRRKKDKTLFLDTTNALLNEKGVIVIIIITFIIIHSSTLSRGGRKLFPRVFTNVLYVILYFFLGVCCMRVLVVCVVR